MSNVIDFNKRSAGEVEAPKPELFGNLVKAHAESKLVADLATSIERTATKREIAARLAKYSHQPTRADNKVRAELQSLLECFTTGRHIR